MRLKPECKNGNMNWRVIQSPFHEISYQLLSDLYTHRGQKTSSCSSDHVYSVGYPAEIGHFHKLN